MDRLNQIAGSSFAWLLLGFIGVWFDPTKAMICAATAIILSKIERLKP